MSAVEGPALVSRALRTDGKRLKLYPMETPGRFSGAQRWFYPLLIIIYAVLPLVPYNGRPLVWLDIWNRRFHVFAWTFNATDVYLLFFLISGFAFSLVVLSALAGRVWCGWACPQTVFIEGIYRRIERATEGDAHKRQRLEASPWGPEKLLRVGSKHALFIVASLFITHVFLAWFAGAEAVMEMVTRDPRENWGAFLFVVISTAIIHFNFTWFREQFCIVLCPYGRLQSVLADRDTLVVGYDATRGEPRGRKGTTTGDCVDCHKCVQVCPTGIDIRAGMQMECIGCAHCIDACDSIMDKLERPRGLIRYDSANGLDKQPRRFLRGRVYGYAVAAVAGLVATGVGLSVRHEFDVVVTRAQGAPREVQGEDVVHRLVLHVTSKAPDASSFKVEVAGPAGSRVILPVQAMELDPFANRFVPFMVVTARGVPVPEPVRIMVTESRTGTQRSTSLRL